MTKFTFEEPHTYKLDGKRLTGVTTIIGCIAKPALIGWAANKAVDYIEDYVKKSKDGELNWDDILLNARKAHVLIKEEAGDIGTRVHEVIENFVKLCIKNGGKENVMFPPDFIYEDDDDLVRKMFDQFLEWAYEEDITFLLSEQRVYSEKHWYAGTVDLVFEKGGKKYIGDIKTSSGIYNEAFIQMGGYHVALEELGKIKDVAGYCVINLPKQLKKDGTAKRNVKYLYNPEECKSAFLNALGLYRFINKVKK